LDNDCDGSVDEGCSCVDGQTQGCGSDIGECEKGTQTCADGIWGACTGAIDATIELCDNKDNNCNSLTDENLLQDCSLQQGVCAGTKQTCDAGLWGACSYGANYETAETKCDGLDNDCDGSVDENNICPVVANIASAGGGSTHSSRFLEAREAARKAEAVAQVASAVTAPAIPAAVTGGASPLTGAAAGLPAPAEKTSAPLMTTGAATGLVLPTRRQLEAGIVASLFSFLALLASRGLVLIFVKKP
jgi:hypothetical protein